MTNKEEISNSCIYSFQVHKIVLRHRSRVCESRGSSTRLMHYISFYPFFSWLLIVVAMFWEDYFSILWTLTEFHVASNNCWWKDGIFLGGIWFGFMIYMYNTYAMHDTMSSMGNLVIVCENDVSLIETLTLLFHYRVIFHMMRGH